MMTPILNSLLTTIVVARVSALSYLKNSSFFSAFSGLDILKLISSLSSFNKLCLYLIFYIFMFGIEVILNRHCAFSHVICHLLTMAFVELVFVRFTGALSRILYLQYLSLSIYEWSLYLIILLLSFIYQYIRAYPHRDWNTPICGLSYPVFRTAMLYEGLLRMKNVVYKWLWVLIPCATNFLFYYYCNDLPLEAAAIVILYSIGFVYLYSFFLCMYLTLSVWNVPVCGTEKAKDKIRFAMNLSLVNPYTRVKVFIRKWNDCSYEENPNALRKWMAKTWTRLYYKSGIDSSIIRKFFAGMRCSKRMLKEKILDQVEVEHKVERIKQIDILGGVISNLTPHNNRFVLPNCWTYTRSRNDHCKNMILVRKVPSPGFSGRVTVIGSDLAASVCAKFAILYKYSQMNHQLYEWLNLNKVCDRDNTDLVTGQDWDDYINNWFNSAWSRIVATSPPNNFMPLQPPSLITLDFFLRVCNLFKWSISAYDISQKDGYINGAQISRFSCQAQKLPYDVICPDNADEPDFFLSNITYNGVQNFHVQCSRQMPPFTNSPGCALPTNLCGVQAICDAYSSITGAKPISSQNVLNSVQELRNYFGAEFIQELSLSEMIYLIRDFAMAVNIVEYGRDTTMASDLYVCDKAVATIGHNDYPVSHWFLVESHFRLTNQQATAVVDTHPTPGGPLYSYYLNPTLSKYPNVAQIVKFDTSVAGQIMNGTPLQIPTPSSSSSSSSSNSSGSSTSSTISSVTSTPTYSRWSDDGVTITDANIGYLYPLAQSQIITALFSHLFPEFPVAFGTARTHHNVYRSTLTHLLGMYARLHGSTLAALQLLVIPGEQNYNLLDGSCLQCSPMGEFTSLYWPNIVHTVNLDNVSFLIPHGPHAFIVVTIPGVHFTNLNYFSLYMGHATLFAHSELKTMTSEDRLTKINRIHNYAIVKLHERVVPSAVEQATMYEFMRMELPSLEHSISVETEGIQYKGQVYEQWLRLQNRTPINRWTRQMFDYLYNACKFDPSVDKFYKYMPSTLRNYIDEHARMHVMYKISNIYFSNGNTIRNPVPLYKTVSTKPIADKFMDISEKYYSYNAYKFLFIRRLISCLFFCLQARHMKDILYSYETRGYGMIWGLIYLVTYMVIDFATWFTTVTLYTTADDKITLALLRNCGEVVPDLTYNDFPEYICAKVLFALGLRLTRRFDQRTNKISYNLVGDFYVIVCNLILWIAFFHDYFEYIRSFVSALVSTVSIFSPVYSYVHDLKDVIDGYLLVSENWPNFIKSIWNFIRQLFFRNDFMRPVGGSGSDRSYIQYQQFDAICAPTWSLLRPKYYARDGGAFTTFEELKAYVKNYHEVPNNKKVFRTGPQISAMKGKKTPHCFSSSVLNLFSAIFARHTASSNLPSFHIRDRFIDFNVRKARKLVKKVNAYFMTNGVCTLEEYIEHLPPNKRELYMQGVLKYQKHAKVNLQLEGFMKTHELLYGSIAESRPRAIWCPDSTLRVYAGWYGYNLIKAVKSILPSFVHGLDCGQLATKLYEARFSVPSATNIDWDGSAHDSNQHAWWIESVDNVLINGTIWEFGARAGWSIDLIKDIQKACTLLDFPIIVYYPGSRQPMVKGTLSGTVFSGHPTRTTLGNTLRVHLLVKWIAFNSGIPKNRYRHFVAGDDVLIFIDSTSLEQFERCVWENMTQYSGVFGIGYKLKKLEKRGNGIDFLSKTGVATDMAEPVLHRYLDRTVIGANYTHKLKKSFGPAEHAWAVTSSILSWCNGLKPIMDYIGFRKQSVPHSVPQKRSDIFWNDPEAYYKLVSHANEHATEDYFESGKPYLPCLPTNYFENDPIAIDNLQLYRYRN